MSESPISLRDETGVERFRGTQSPGGGSIPQGVLASAERTFTEEATAGTYTATLPIVAGTAIADVVLYFLADWAADAAALNVGDSHDPAAFFGPDVAVIGNGTYSLAAGDSGALVAAPALDSVYVPMLRQGLGFLARYDADDLLTLSVVTTIAVPPVVPTGQLLAKVIYFTPVTAVAASFA